MKTEDLAEAVKRAKAALLAGKDPDVVLTEFAVEVGGCATCHEDSLCFKCKFTEVFGERVTFAMPILIPKLTEMVKEWYRDRVARKAAEAQAEKQRGKFSPGREPF